MKVIFLDIDGVLNSDRYLRGREEAGVVIDPSRMALLQRLVRATDAAVVLSSSWREHWDADPARCDASGAKIHEIFSAYGVTVADKTPSLAAGRVEEIRAWLAAHPAVERFAVLDDALLWADFLDGHFVKTSSFYGGLDETDVARVIEILNG